MKQKMNSKIIIVGNGTTILEKENGKLIDSYETVVRFNNYGTNGFEKFAGKKTDIWFNVINFVNKENEWRMKEFYKKIYLHSWEWDLDKNSLFLDFKKFFKDKEEDFIETTKPQIIKEIQNFANDFSYSGISTGLIAIWIMLKYHISVDIIGFDWWSTEKHHYNDNAIRGTLHKPDKEKVIIDKLQEKGMLFFIK